MKKSNSPKIKHKGAGHRKRLRDKFLHSGLAGFHDYEVVELLLTLGTPMKDCKPMAKEVIKKFRGLRGVLNATLEDLQVIKGIGPANAFGIKLFQAIAERFTKESIPKKLELNSLQAIVNYLQNAIGREKKEHFIALYLDTRENLIANRSISVGTLNASLVHPREVFEPAVSSNAASIIIAHNHPSGSVEPSSEDRETTKRLVETGITLDIGIRDHIIVSQSEYFSFQQQLLL